MDWGACRQVKAAQADPTIMDIVRANVRAIGPEQGLAMALARGKSQMPYWSRLAIREYRKRGLSRAQIAAAFICSLGTVTNALQEHGRGYQPLSGERRLTPAQEALPGQWRKAGGKRGPIWTTEPWCFASAGRGEAMGAPKPPGIVLDVDAVCSRLAQVVMVDDGIISEAHLAAHALDQPAKVLPRRHHSEFPNDSVDDSETTESVGIISGQLSLIPPYRHV